MAHACINSCTIPGLSYPITIEYYYPTKKYQIKTKERVAYNLFCIFSQSDKNLHHTSWTHTTSNEIIKGGFKSFKQWNYKI